MAVNQYNPNRYGSSEQQGYGNGGQPAAVPPSRTPYSSTVPGKMTAAAYGYGNLTSGPQKEKPKWQMYFVVLVCFIMILQATGLVLILKPVADVIADYGFQPLLSMDGLIVFGSIVFQIVTIIMEILLLKFKKWAFYIVSAVYALDVVYEIYSIVIAAMSGMTPEAIGAIIGTLFAMVLRIVIFVTICTGAATLAHKYPFK